MSKIIYRKPQAQVDPINDSTFNPFSKPIAKVKTNEIIIIHSWDAFGGVVNKKQTFEEALQRGKVGSLNPITGPLYILDAKPGDTLEIKIIDIKLPNIGGTSIIPGFGALEGWLTYSEPRTKISEIKNNAITYETDDKRKIEIQAEPFIGTIGVSPKYEAIQTLTPGTHGGNMDCPDVKPGNTLYLPIYQEGALFGLGDVHAIQGDGEICGTAVEIEATVTLEFNLIKKSINWPRIESGTEIMTVCSARPLEDAARLAYNELINWLVEDFGWSQMDAYMFLSLTAKARIAQIVDPLYTVVAKLEKKYLLK
jgi:acetamidase/formamidase